MKQKERIKTFVTSLLDGELNDAQRSCILGEDKKKKKEKKKKGSGEDRNSSGCINRGCKNYTATQCDEQINYTCKNQDFACQRTVNRDCINGWDGMSQSQV